MAKKVTKKTVTKKTGTQKKVATRKRTAAKKSTKSAIAATSVSEAQVRVRAYEIFCSGRNASNPDADWLQAEQELTVELRP